MSVESGGIIVGGLLMFALYIVLCVLVGIVLKETDWSALYEAKFWAGVILIAVTVMASGYGAATALGYDWPGWWILSGAWLCLVFIRVAFVPA